MEKIHEIKMFGGGGGKGGTVNPEQVKEIVNEEIQSIVVQPNSVEGGRADTVYPDSPDLNNYLLSKDNVTELSAPNTTNKQVLGAEVVVRKFKDVDDALKILSDKIEEGLSSIKLPSTIFSEVLIDVDQAVVDYTRTPNADINLATDSSIVYLSIVNTKDGDTGKILLRQPGFKQVTFDSSYKGSITLPINAGTVALVSYYNVNGVVYLQTDKLIDDEVFPTPQTVIDLSYSYYDNSSVLLNWTAPYSNKINEKVTFYELKYSYSPIDATDQVVWNGLIQVLGLPEPVLPGEQQSFHVNGLRPNKEYYFYIKSVKINNGVRYYSNVSNPIYVRTVGIDDTDATFKLPITADNIVAPQTEVVKENGVVMNPDKMFDEQEFVKYLADGYVDTSVSGGFTTSFNPYPYSRVNYPYVWQIDLNYQCKLDKIFLLTNNGSYSIYYKTSISSPEIFHSTITGGYNKWHTIDLLNTTARYIIFKFEQFQYISTASCKSELNPDLYWGVIPVLTLHVYGRPLSETPINILTPRRRSVELPTVDEFVCTNCHGYMAARPHKYVSGKHIRIYSNAGRYTDESEDYIATYNEVSPVPSTIAEAKFIFDSIGWYYHNSPGNKSGDAQMQDYKTNGFDPYLCVLGSMYQSEYYRVEKTGDYGHRRLYPFTDGWMINNYKTKNLDNYFLPNAWRPVMKIKVMNGSQDFLAESTNPHNYKHKSKFIYNLMARYGDNTEVPDESIDLLPVTLGSPLKETVKKGLNVLSGVEYDNEIDGTWLGRCAYHDPNEYAANISASYDGHCGTLRDEDNKPYFGFKSICPNKLSILPGLISPNHDYMNMAIQWWKTNRQDGSLPFDVINIHHYSTNAGGQTGDDSGKILRSINPEADAEIQANGALGKLVDLRDRYCPDKAIWLSEWGYGESGSKSLNHKFSVDSFAGKSMGSWVIPDRHKSEVKGYLAVRGFIHFMSIGIQKVNWFSTFSDCYNFYDKNGQSAGAEVHDFDNCTDLTPGAKYNAALRNESPIASNGFDTHGFFAGAYLNNGGYPLSKSLFIVGTFRNRLKGYKFIGWIKHELSHIKIACFRKVGSDKGAYAIYQDTYTNSGTSDVVISVPMSLNSVTLVKNYIPIMPDPRKIPQAQMSNPPAEFYPIIGPVGLWNDTVKGYLFATQKCDADGNVTHNMQWAHKQVDTLCDWLDNSEEGQKGLNGVEEVKLVTDGTLRLNVTEEPVYLFFDAVPDTDYEGKVTDLNSVSVSANSIMLTWNNTNPFDTHYEIFKSVLPDSEYSIFKTIPVTESNSHKVTGLEPNTGYYFKMRPVAGGKHGEFSETTYSKTLVDIAAPTNLVCTQRMSSALKLAWDYVATKPEGFAKYCIQRETKGLFVTVGNVTDFATKEFLDNGLVDGTSYTYRVLVLGENSKSTYSNELTVSTLLASEAAPVALSAITDKAGSSIYVTFSITMAETIPSSLISSFRLVQNGTPIDITSITRDSTTSRIKLGITSGQLLDMADKAVVKLSYTAPATDKLMSVHGVAADSFNDLNVKVIVGNYSNISNTYKINLSKTVITDTALADWNQFAVETLANSNAVLKALKSTTEFISTISVKCEDKWGGSSDSDITCICGIEGIPDNVRKSCWTTDYFISSVNDYSATFRFAGLDVNKSYNVKIFSGNQFGDPRRINMKCNGFTSNTVDTLGNTDTYMVLSDLTPTSKSELSVSIKSLLPDNGRSPYIQFIILEECDLSE